MTQRIRSRRARGLLRASVLAAGMTVAPLAGAETGWVDDQVRLNLRTGPGNQYRILDSIETGDSVQILSRGDGWTEVNADGKTGWVPDGYLQAEPPAVVKLARIESEAAELRTRSKQLGEDAEKLRSEHEQLATRESEQRAELERLTRDNLELRAGARWPEWIAGACILAVGMALGALLRGSARRQTPRIRL
jgi:SH3 domain protein